MPERPPTPYDAMVDLAADHDLAGLLADLRSRLEATADEHTTAYVPGRLVEALEMFLGSYGPDRWRDGDA
ncbi:hypothetical protein [Lapillicoccus jejuensis]|uniref:Uncharacterized protein n=1 Tax=Lapillicoccus jejuensis TaxID=402171 RepID=A0A542E1K2_9MICO|nr:hypothetical protein [Lapillicoccus jejuensis]TQJ09149.1 hypothetical protein FB458_2257 [Lapillicoccus jejuensis]